MDGSDSILQIPTMMTMSSSSPAPRSRGTGGLVMMITMMSGNSTRIMSSGFSRLSLELEDNALTAARFSDRIHAMDPLPYRCCLELAQNAFIMALAVPLGQSALSLVFDKVSGRTSESWKSAPRRKTKKKQFTRAAANNTRTNKGKQEPNKTGGEKESYSSWLNTDGGLQGKGGQRVPKYGGWDQLDDQVETQKRATSRKGNGAPKQRKEDKFSRVGRDRVRDTPLLLRLLIAALSILDMRRSQCNVTLPTKCQFGAESKLGKKKAN
ncbi:hypothetical protein GOBAR_DD15207 [Gossypium barbadense]|nr:hypothetical protein GOBAR_DD15207 [Gossypium barbadense]